MIPIITYSLDKANPDQFTVDPEYVAFKGKKCYIVHCSTRSYTTSMSTIGRVRVVFSEDGTEILAMAYPLFGLNNDFELISVKLMTDYTRKANAYKRLRKKYGNEISEPTTRSYSISG